jgi:hypothetical protein
MVEFEELRQLWQKQVPADSAIALDGRAMSTVLRKFHRRQTVINCIRAALMLGVLIWAPIRTHMAFRPVLGIILMEIGMAIYLVQDWRNQIGIARLDFTKPSVGFVESSLQRLNDMRYPFRRTFWVFIGSAVIGFNLMTVPPSGATWMRQLTMHCSATTFPFVAYWLGVKFRAKRFDLECRPIVEKLLSMKLALEEGAA